MKRASDIDALFAAPLAEFTAARNALAAQLKKEGRLPEAERVKGMSKPPATAWAVNQLYWRHRKDFDRLLAIGDKVRDAQAGKKKNLRTLLDQRRRMISDAADLAAAILTESGHGVSTDARRRIVTTLESLAAWGRSNADVQPGRLTADLEPMGFDGLAALLKGTPFKPAKVLEFPKEKKVAAEDPSAARARVAAALKAAEKALVDASREAARAAAAAEKTAARVGAIAEEKQEIEVRYRKAELEARTAADQARNATRAVTEAERAVTKAREALK